MGNSLYIDSKHYFPNKIHILVPMKIPTARTINIGIIICPSTMLENISAYATDIDEALEASEHSLVKSNFVLYEPIHSNHDSEYNNDGFSVLHEKTNLKKHFSYGHFELNSSEELTNNVLNHGRA